MVKSIPTGEFLTSPNELSYLVQTKEQDDSYLVEVPKRDLSDSDVNLGEVYRAAFTPSFSSSTGDQPEQNQESSRPPHPGPPTTVGETRTVEIENTREQGNGNARVERGYVIIVPETTLGDRVKIKVTDVRENMAFARPLSARTQSPIQPNVDSPREFSV